MMLPRLAILSGLVTAFSLFLPAMPVAAASATSSNATDYPSIQAALDANPHVRVYLPPGDYPIDAALEIRGDGSGLVGPGRIIQSNPDQDILRINKLANVRIQDVTLTRAEGAQETRGADGILVSESLNVEIDGVKILDNRGPGGAITLHRCTNSTIRDSTIDGYKGPAIDDRTQSPLMGYAFKCIDGTGVKAFHCDGTMLLNNRIVERLYLPTREIHDRLELGKVTVLPKEKGPLTPAGIFETSYTDNWHQGSGIIVGGLGNAKYSIISGNYIENAGQGIDIHADNVTITNNIVNGAMIGMKAMHGSRNVLIDGNQFSRMDLWGLMLGPGAASRAATAASDGEEAAEQNVDGGTVVSNNIFSRFGQGGQRWNRQAGGLEGETLQMIAILCGQLPVNPPIRDVVITGNMVYDSGRDAELTEGTPQAEEPLYRYAIYVDQRQSPAPPEGIRIYNNILHPGRAGVSNIPLEP